MGQFQSLHTSKSWFAIKTNCGYWMNIPAWHISVAFMIYVCRDARNGWPSLSIGDLFPADTKTNRYSHQQIRALNNLSAAPVPISSKKPTTSFPPSNQKCRFYALIRHSRFPQASECLIKCHFSFPLRKLCFFAQSGHSRVEKVLLNLQM